MQAEWRKGRLTITELPFIHYVLLLQVGCHLVVLIQNGLQFFSQILHFLQLCLHIIIKSTKKKGKLENKFTWKQKFLATNRTLLSLLNAQIAFYNTKTPAIFEYSLNCSPIGWYKYTQTWELRTSSILDSRTPGTFIFQREPWSLTRWSYKLPQY